MLCLDIIDKQSGFRVCRDLLEHILMISSKSRFFHYLYIHNVTKFLWTLDLHTQMLFLFNLLLESWIHRIVLYKMYVLQWAQTGSNMIISLCT